MSEQTDKQIIYICSDSVGETAETVVNATLRQFDTHQISKKRIGHIRSREEVISLMEEARETGGVVAYTLVQPELRETMRDESIRLNVRSVDIMGPMIQAFEDAFNDSPKQTPGLLHRLDETYFSRVEAIEFSVRCDDGRDIGSLVKADIVLIGVSRTSKTPLSIFLAHKGYKVANFPVVPEVRIPGELHRIPPRKIIGLMMSEEKLAWIRRERLNSVGLPEGSLYADRDRVREELLCAASLMKELGCRVLDVTNKAIEETAGLILEMME